MSGAYWGAAERKGAVLERLESALAAGQVLDDTGVWSDPQGSAAGVLARSSDLRDFEAYTGLPAAMGGLLDAMALYLSQDAGARDAFLRGFLAAIRPGADGAALGAAMLVDFLHDPMMMRAAGDHGAIGALRDAALAAQAMAAQGQDVPRATWSALRSTAMELGESEQGMQAAVLDFVERTAWPVNRSRSLLAEGLRTVIHLASSFAVQDWGWSAQDQREVDATLHAIEAEALARGEDQPDYPALLAARVPELEARFRSQMMIHADSFGAHAKIWADRLIALAEKAQ